MNCIFRRLTSLLFAFTIVWTAVPPAAGQTLLDAFSEAVDKFTLENGLTFITVERPEAPVVSFFTYVDVGAANEVKGITGIAHMFEHMAFKGTRNIGSKDIDQELIAIAEMEAAYLALKATKAQTPPVSDDVLAEREAAFEAAQAQAKSLLEDGAFEEIIERNGGVGINASTSSDATRYFYSLPSNKVELWFSLEADRFMNPVLREFYTERDVVMEERRMRTDSQPIGRMLEEFLTTAYKAHPYGEPVVGHMSDLETFTLTEAEAFYKAHYIPQNMTMVLVGDIDAAEVRRLAQTYFGTMSSGVATGQVETVEPPQLGERRITIEDAAQPVYLSGYHKGSMSHPDDPVFDVLEDILSGGRTGRIYRSLVEEQQIALQAYGLHNYPGSKYPNLFLFLGIPNQGVDPMDIEVAIDSILVEIVENGVTDAELERAKNRARADLVRGLQSNTGVASQLAFYQANTGDWRNLFARLDALSRVSSADVQRVAAETFIPRNRTVAIINTTSGAE
jgi:predicted Zn-dependent peptidase